MKITVRIRGESLLRQKFAALGTIAQRQIIAEAADAGGRVCEGFAKILAPVDLGTLRASINVTHHATNGPGAEVRVGSMVHYAPYVEFGTGVFAEGGRGRRTPWRYFNPRWNRWVRTIGSIPRPFLRPALIGHKHEIMAAIGRTLKRLIAISVRK